MSTAVLERTESAKSVGRTVGALVLAHLALAMFLPFVIVDRIRGTEGILANGAAHASELRAAVLIFFLGTSLAIAASVAAWPVVQRYSSALALWLVTMAAAAFTLQAVDSGALLSLLSLSQEYAKAGAAKAEVFEAAGMVANAARRWTHFTYLLIAVVWMGLVHFVLFRCALVPRALAALGMIGCAMQIGAVTIRAIYGHPPIMQLAIPLAPIHAAVALWLMVKGFREWRTQNE
jgi:Domain of unknown function (DUF4386)